MKKGTHVFFAFQEDNTGYPRVYVQDGILEEKKNFFCKIRVLDRFYQVETKRVFLKEAAAYCQLLEDLSDVADSVKRTLDHIIQEKGNAQ